VLVVVAAVFGTTAGALAGMTPVLARVLGALLCCSYRSWRGDQRRKDVMASSGALSCYSDGSRADGRACSPPVRPGERMWPPHVLATSLTRLSSLVELSLLAAF
jgi:hypothetical protein